MVRKSKRKRKKPRKIRPKTLTKPTDNTTLSESKSGQTGLEESPTYIQLRNKNATSDDVIDIEYTEPETTGVGRTAWDFIIEIFGKHMLEFLLMVIMMAIVGFVIYQDNSTGLIKDTDDVIWLIEKIAFFECLPISIYILLKTYFFITKKFF